VRCAICKGYRFLCGRSFCPILKRIGAIGKFQVLDRVIFGSSPPSIFVGDKFSYITPPIEGDTSHLGDPLRWEDVTLEDVIRMKVKLVMGECRFNRDDGFVMSVKPVDSEMVLKRRPKLKIHLNEVSPVFGPKAELERIRVVENPKVPRFIERIVGDEMKAGEGIVRLYERGFGEYYIVRLLSAGLLGVEKRFVPTKRSIVAVEDVVGEHLKLEIINYSPIERFEIYRSEFLGNEYTVLMIPLQYSFELLEVWLPKSLFGFSGVLRDYEFFKKRGYARETLGAYYSARLSVLEFLRERRRQARVVVFREVTEGYHTPVGSWQIRVGVRKALKRRVGVFDDLGSALNLLRSLLRHPLEEYLKRSMILNVGSLKF